MNVCNLFSTAINNNPLIMNEQQRSEKKKYAGEKKPSMKRRDDYNDYRGRRMYMITIEVEDRRPLFGVLRGDVNVKEHGPQAPHIELSPLGQAVSQEWMGIPRYYPQIEVMGLQMMPDHLHGILFVHESLPVHLSQVITGFKTGCNRILRTMLKTAATQPQPTQNPAALPQPGMSIHRGACESFVAPQAVSPSQPSPASHLFASGFNDLILKNYDEFQKWKAYLADNPRRLMTKRDNPTLLHPFFDLHIGNHTYSGIGNRQLLAAQHRVAVRISRRITGQQLDAEIAHYLQLAHNGTVLISPAISPGEKAVMRAAFNAGLPTIVIMANGFTPMSKPHGEQFYACAEGRLLMLSAWEHHNERQKLTANQCQQMNLMALELCNTSIASIKQ